MHVIKINNKDYSLSWGMGAIEIYCDKMDCDIEGLNWVTDPTDLLRMQKALVVLIESALQNAKELAGEKLDLSYRQLQAWLSEIPQEELKEITDDFIKSKYLGKTIGEYVYGLVPDDEEDSKKKLESEESPS